MKQVIVPDDIERLATQTVNAALAVHRTLGAGLLESAYQECLGIEPFLGRVVGKRRKQRHLSMALGF